MATARDAAEIFNLPSGPSQPRPKKKKIEPTPRPSHYNRELHALMGDSVPPINIIEQTKYKTKAPHNKLFKTRHWGNREFIHGGREDGLQLKHWKRAIPNATRAIATPDEPIDITFEDEFPSEKWNVKVDVPSYTDEQYETNFQSEEWTREETDYLLDLCREFDLRWVLIADRYDHAANPTRTMEAMKLRYYTIAAVLMETKRPRSDMTGAEFQLWEKMRTFDAKTEITRKAMAEKLFERSKEEAEEEKILLEELSRITKHEEEFIKLRKDLYSRLESAPPSRRNERGEEASTAMYHTSAGLTALLQQLLSRERKFKRPLTNGESQQTPIDPRRGQPNQYSRRDTMDSQTGSQKKGSTSAPTVRNLAPAEEVKFGVSHPQERLTSGVQFRHQKIDRLTMAKSAVQTSKIQAALTQLGIPPRLLMPTERVCREFERLIDGLNKLLDVRKNSEKVSSEIRILEEVKRKRLGLPEPGEKTDTMEVDETQIEESIVEESAVVEDDAEGEDDDADGEKDEVDESAMQVEEDEDEAGEKSMVADDDDDVDQSYGDLGKDEEEEEEEQEEEDEPAVGQESDAEEDDDVEPDVDDEDEAEVNESDAADDSGEEGEEEAEEDDEEVEAEEDGEEVEAEEDVEEVEASEAEPSRPSSSAGARVHKRSASVLSDASKAGSNRSGMGRKKRR